MSIGALRHTDTPGSVCECGGAMAGLTHHPPPRQVSGALLLQRKKNENTHTLYFPSCKKRPRSHQTAVRFDEKMFRWKSSHQAAPAVAHGQTSALPQLRISGKNSRFQNIFRGHINSLRLAGAHVRVLLEHKKPIKQGATITAWPV